MSAGEEKFRIVLGKSDPVRHAAIAARLASVFGVSETLSRQIVKAAPIILLGSLSRAQAMELLQALSPLRQAGADLRIDMSSDRSISQISWPTAPRIAGRELSSYEVASRPAAADASCSRCPSCGARLGITLAALGSGSAVVPSPAAPVAPTAPVAPPAPPVTADKSVAATALRPVVPPPATPPAAAPAPASVPPRPAPVAAAGSKSGAIQVDLGDLEEEDPLFGDIKPLIDTGPLKKLGSLEDFETGLQKAIGGPPPSRPAPVAPALGPAAGRRGVVSAAPAPAGRPSAPPSGAGFAALLREKGPYSVVISAVGNAKAVPLVMEILGVPENEARAQMQKVSLQVARGVSREAALQIATRFKTVVSQVRILQARA